VVQCSIPGSPCCRVLHKCSRPTIRPTSVQKQEIKKLSQPNLPDPSTPLAPSSYVGLLHSSVLSTTASDHLTSNATSLYPYHNPFSPTCPSSSFLGPPSLFLPSSSTNPGDNQLGPGSNSSTSNAPGSTVTYHGVCLTMWSHVDAQRSMAIRCTLEAGCSHKESAQSLVAVCLEGLQVDTQDPTYQARRNHKYSRHRSWATNSAAIDGETDMDAEMDGGISESDYKVGSIGPSHNPGKSTLFLPGDTMFWLLYALSTYILYTYVWLRSINVTFPSPCV